MIDVILTGTGSPLPDPNRAGPSTLVRAGGATFLVDCGRGVLMRLAAVGSGASSLEAVLITHLHSDHITDLSDIITTRWITTFAPSPLQVIGPPGIAKVVDGLLAALSSDISYRTTHHIDLDGPPPVEVTEITEGIAWDNSGVTVLVAPTDHRPVEPSIAFRISHEDHSVVVAGDTVPCPSLDQLSTDADLLVITTIRKDVIKGIGLQRLEDVIDYHSSPEEAAQTATRAGIKTLALTHYVPALVPGTEEEWRSRAAEFFEGEIVIGDDLTVIQVPTPAQ